MIGLIPVTVLSLEEPCGVSSETAGDCETLECLQSGQGVLLV